jgi:choline dehydrogenase
MNHEAELLRLTDSFEQGKISRRALLTSAAALGTAVSLPIVLGAKHAAAQAADSYDYIVIGAGAGGCAVAARLAEDPTKTVLVLEAGPPDENPYTQIPVAFSALFKSDLDWNYTSTPQQGMDGKTIYMPRGKVFGGSTSINAMIYMRGHPACFDGWAVDNPGWSYADVLPYFMRGENNERGASDVHGVGGPLNVAELRDPNPLSKALVAAAVEQGYAAQGDFNAGDQVGFGLYQVTQKDGFRGSAAKSSLHPAAARGNLTVQGEALVLGLVIDAGRCTGVRFSAGGAEHVATAGTEVVLAAGAIGSPQILMLSGIGPRADLEALGIAVVLDLPGVGQNLQDHAMVAVAHECTQPITLAAAMDPEQAKLFETGMGMLTSNVGEAGGFLKVMPDAAAPDLQFHFAPGYFVEDGVKNPTGHGFTLLPGIVGTKSVGSLKLASADPTAKPLIDPAFFSDANDVEVVVEGIKIARKILASAAFDAYRGAEVFPGPAVQDDDALRAYIRGSGQSIYHPVGTCKMGSDAMAVVDAALKVRGIDGLRVADASIMPTITNGNTQAVCMMIGEKCADLIRG